MKKLLKALLLIPLITLCGCDNLESTSIKKVHIFNPNIRCLEVTNCRLFDKSSYVKADTKLYGKIIIHANNCLLIYDLCPFCDYGKTI